MSKIKNISIFVIITAIFVLIYIFFVKKSPDTGALVSSFSDITTSANVDTSIIDPSITQDFLSILLNVKNIKLNDSIFSDKAFESLSDSSITLVPDGNEGRPNPFAQFGADNVETPALPLDIPPAGTTPETTLNTPATPTNNPGENTEILITP